MPVVDTCTGIPYKNGKGYCPGDSKAPSRLLRGCPGCFRVRTIFLSEWNLSHSRGKCRNRGSEKNQRCRQDHLPPIYTGGNEPDRRENSSRHRHKGHNLHVPNPIVFHSGRGPTVQEESFYTNLPAVASVHWS